MATFAGIRRKMTKQAQFCLQIARELQEAWKTLGLKSFTLSFFRWTHLGEYELMCPEYDGATKVEVREHRRLKPTRTILVSLFMLLTTLFEALPYLQQRRVVAYLQKLYKEVKIEYE